MNYFINNLRSRRSIRVFEKAPLAKEQIVTLKESLLRSPTSRGRNPWQFVMIDEPALLEKISRAKMHGSNFLAGANIAFIICGDEEISDVWIEDCSIAAITLQYTAHSLGLGSCWAQIRLRDHDEANSAEAYLQQLLNIPSHVRVASVIGIGQPAENKNGHAENDLAKDKFHLNKY
jgi:nitroreductase